MTENVFSTLSRYVTRADENYLTEAFAFLLRLGLQRDPVYGLDLLNWLCNRPPGTQFVDPRTVAIDTQVTEDMGTPDMQIRSGESTLIYVEVKHDAPLGHLQLERYRDQLQESGFTDTNLVLLSRSKTATLNTTLSRSEYHHICWYEIYNWFASTQAQDEIYRYMGHSFMAFLEDKNMSMHRVTWDYINGIPALLHLVDMIEAALTEVQPGTALRKTGGWNWRGYYLLDDLFFGVRYDLPLVVVCENNKGYPTVTYKRDLDLETEHFFALSKDEQFELLVQFIQDALATALPDHATE